MTNKETDIYAAAFFMSDFAAVENGKLYVSGGFWNQFRLASFPSIVNFSIVAVLNIPWRAYHQNHKFEVFFEDADGKRLPGELGGDFTVGTAPEMKVGDPTLMPIAAAINGFALQHAGDYSAVLHVDGQEISRWPFRASQLFVQQNRPISPSDLPAGL